MFPQVWADGPGFHVSEHNRTVSGLRFVDVSINGTRVSETSFESYFALGRECAPDSLVNDSMGNVRDIGFEVTTK